MRQPIEGSEHFSFDTSSLASPFVSPSLQKVLLTYRASQLAPVRSIAAREWHYSISRIRQATLGS
jgi:hypothetical protein